MTDKPKVIIIRETAWESWASDLGSVLFLGAMVGVGILLGSTTLQWIAGIVGILAMASRQMNKHRIMTVL